MRLDLRPLEVLSWMTILSSWALDPDYATELFKQGTFAVVAIVGAAVAVTGATAKAVDGAVKAKRAKGRAADAKIELDKNKDMFASLDTSNPYQGLENTMEDLTVNQKEAEFSKQQSMQSQANIMQGMKGAAGGSGIAGLAQAMANQGSLDAQKSAASIGKQEQSNQMLRQQEAGKIQGLEREGELISRQAEMGKVSSLLGMSADELANAKKERADAQNQMWDGISEAGNTAMSFGMGGGGGGGKNKKLETVDTIDPALIEQDPSLSLENRGLITG